MGVQAFFVDLGRHGGLMGGYGDRLRWREFPRMCSYAVFSVFVLQRC